VVVLGNAAQAGGVFDPVVEGERKVRAEMVIGFYRLQDGDCSCSWLTLLATRRRMRV